MKCLVTGATGFIGSSLCRRLLAGDVELVAVGREQPTTAQLSGVATVYHCAGIAHQSAQASDYEDVNCRRVIALARAAAAAGVRRFVFLSSVNAAPDAGPYGFWKWRAEQDLIDHFDGADMSVCIVRPALVYGVGVKGNLRTLMRLVGRGLPRPPASSARSLIGLPDLCEALALVDERAPVGLHLLTATDGESYDLRRIHDAVRAARGKAPARGWLPAVGWRVACRAVDLVRGRSADAGIYQKLFGSGEHSNRELCETLHWQPRDTLEDLMPAMLEDLCR
jgi:nucleoside-diphosphate-sugar epimerase